MELPDIESIPSVPMQTLYAIDVLNEISLSHQTQPVVLNRDNNLVIKGRAVDEQTKSLAGGVYIDFDGKIFPSVYGLDRVDVAQAFALPYRYSGFECAIPVAEIGQGQHVLSIKILTNDQQEYYTSEVIRIQITS